MVVFAAGLTLTVAPLTATVLGAAPAQFAGVASAVNNDVARTAGLVAVAVTPARSPGSATPTSATPSRFSDGFQLAMLIAGRHADRGRCARLADHPPPAVKPAVARRSPPHTAPSTPRRCASTAPRSPDPDAADLSVLPLFARGYSDAQNDGMAGQR